MPANNRKKVYRNRLEVMLDDASSGVVAEQAATLGITRSEAVRRIIRDWDRRKRTERALQSAITNKVA